MILEILLSDIPTPSFLTLHFHTPHGEHFKTFNGCNTRKCLFEHEINCTVFKILHPSYLLL